MAWGRSLTRSLTSVPIAGSFVQSVPGGPLPVWHGRSHNGLNCECPGYSPSQHSVAIRVYPSKASLHFGLSLVRLPPDRSSPGHLEFDGSAPWGRYGKASDSVMVRLRAMQDAISFPLDYVYTGKALLQLEQLALSGRFARGSRLLFLHTGGYQAAPIEKIKTLS